MYCSMPSCLSLWVAWLGGLRYQLWDVFYILYLQLLLRVAGIHVQDYSLFFLIAFLFLDSCYRVPSRSTPSLYLYSYRLDIKSKMVSSPVMFGKDQVSVSVTASCCDFSQDPFLGVPQVGRSYSFSKHGNKNENGKK